MSNQSFNDRIAAAGIKTIRTGDRDHKGREIILLEYNGEQMHRPATPDGAVDEIKQVWGIEI